MASRYSQSPILKAHQEEQARNRARVLEAYPSILVANPKWLRIAQRKERDHGMGAVWAYALDIARRTNNQEFLQEFSQRTTPPRVHHSYWLMAHASVVGEVYGRENTGRRTPVAHIQNRIKDKE